MLPRFLSKPFRGRTALLMTCLSIAGVVTLTGASKSRAITKLTLDPTADVVPLFDGIEQKSLDVSYIAKDSKGGNLFITNTSDKPLTIQMPKAFAAVHVMKQIGGAGGNVGGGGGFGGQGGGGGQSVGGGGGFGGGGGGFGGQGGGGGLFSVPAEKTAKIKIKTVCLEHGKAEPRPKMEYEIKPLEEFTSNGPLLELVESYGSSRSNSEFAAVQAAAWHLANDMSWQELAQKKFDRVGRPDEPYFSGRQLQAAQGLVTVAVTKSKEREEEKAKEGGDSVRTYNEEK